MLLAIDIGNTKIKTAVFENNTLIEKHIFNKDEENFFLEKIIKKFNSIKDIVFSSVGDEAPDIFSHLKPTYNITEINIYTKLPFKNNYATPNTLGIDRIVLAAGAVLKYTNCSRLIIDAGTCITYDFIDSENNYLGGAISPGIELRYKSLHNFTAKLPLLSVENPENFIGNSTAQSIHSGIINGITHEIEGFINQYEKKYGNLNIILTGGNADFLAKRLKNTIFANSNFLLESLNYLYQYINEK